MTSSPPVFWHDTLDSTNLHAGQMVAAGSAEDCWIMARKQSAGKGRANREWVSPVGNFMGSRLWRIGDDLTRIGLLSLAVGGAVRDAVSSFWSGPQEVKTKWPNDIYIGMQKISGILIESHRAPDGIYWAAIGIGVNLVQAPEIADGRQSQRLSKAGNPVSPETFLTVLSPRLSEMLMHWPPSGEAFAQAWGSTAFGIGEPVSLSNGDNGIFLGITRTGAARVKLDIGHETVVHAGDLTFQSLEKARNASGN